MRSNILLLVVLALATFSCVADQASSDTQSLLDELFPNQFNIVAGDKAPSKTDSLILVQVQSKTNPDLQFTLDYYPAKDQGGLQKDAVQNAFKAAQTNAKPAGELLKALQKSGLKNILVGADMAQHTVVLQLYEEPFSSAFSSRIKQIQKICADWAAQRKMSPCKLTLLVMDPKAWGQKFKGIIDARFINYNDPWIYAHTIADARADLADPDAAEFLPGSLRLSGNREMDIRKKAYAKVNEFLLASQTTEFHVELQSMVNVEWDLRSMDKIRYFFPYCQATEETKNDSCMGNFAGRVVCSYNFKTGKMQVALI
ncbi:hypothetical protein [Haliscomenobacter hydrossis]|uniref:Uncharacterized protein n=1 Tax=Haliscomenobacter hydrossis (strain ATCC 27775 / DSM 1100 / LMG 10767 / O) TaxID=760192 RepID=F4KU08_HALH1|nr:hypothetical protein [Haliscomenobacter hydrossis]AEE49144.1 hypothetical protein Halhy_1249 [Haliscomenobacter hydrossis DSM 1100]